MKIRMHCGGYDESMATARTIFGTMDSIAEYLSQNMSDTISVDLVRVIPYGYGEIDERNGWDTHMVLINNIPYAFTDEMP